jgi:hypothetical protein
MEKEFIPMDLALRLKSLGFDEPCIGFRYIEKNKPEESPTFSQAFRWFRQEHNLKFHIREDVWNNWCSLKMIRHDDYISIGEYKTYEESELACLKKLIEIIESK